MVKKTSRGSFALLFLIMLGTGLVADICPAQEFPSREIKLMVPLAPGGGVDIVARLFAEKVEKLLGTTIVVVNNAAGGGAVASLTVAQAKPDGYTLLAGPTGSIITKPMLTPELAYRHTDFTPICQTIVMPVALWVKNDAPWKTLKELVEFGKKNPKGLRASVAWPGGFLQVLTDLLKIESGVPITNIPTQGGTAQSAALLGGHAEVCMDTIATNISFLRAGRMRALVSTHKISEFPAVKTFEEEGYPGVNIKMWHGIFGPKNLPKPVVTKLTQAFEGASRDPSLQEQLAKQHIISDYRDPEATSKLVENERAVTFKILKQSGMIK